MESPVQRIQLHAFANKPMLKSEVIDLVASGTEDYSTVAPAIVPDSGAQPVADSGALEVKTEVVISACMRARTKYTPMHTVHRHTHA
jgi:hypothetical protein